MEILRYNEEKHRNSNNYFWLLIFFSTLLFFPVFSVFFRGLTELVFQVSASIVIIWGAFVVTQNKKELLTCSLLAFFAMLGIWLDESFFQPSKGATVFRAISSIFYFAYLGRHISLQLVENNERPNINLIYGAVIVFFIIGIIGGDLCILLDLAEPRTFFDHDNPISSYNYYYFSFVTLTTIGYGDFTPSNESGRALALLIGLFGQIYLTIAMAIIIGKYLNGERADKKGLKNDK